MIKSTIRVINFIRFSSPQQNFISSFELSCLEERDQQALLFVDAMRKNLFTKFFHCPANRHTT